MIWHIQCPKMPLPMKIRDTIKCRHMKYIGALFFLLTIYGSCFAQQRGILSVTLTKDYVDKDSCHVYTMSIINNNDSSVCVLHSLFINLTSENPQGLAVYSADTNSEEYRFQYSFKDTGYNFEVVPYLGELILPYQKLTFKIRVLPSKNDKARTISFEYFYLNDFSYRDFMAQMKKVGSWYYKYNRLKEMLSVPVW
jgi:hypothetical protein